MVILTALLSFSDSKPCLDLSDDFNATKHAENYYSSFRQSFVYLHNNTLDLRKQFNSTENYLKILCLAESFNATTNKTYIVSRSKTLTLVLQGSNVDTNNCLRNSTMNKSKYLEILQKQRIFQKKYVKKIMT